MKRQIRRGVFETNSSSTHSVSIFTRKTKQYSDIPKNSVIIIDGSYEYGTDIIDEVGKLNFVVTMLATIMEDKVDYCRWEKKSFDEMVDWGWFKWLAETIKEESNTNLIYEHPSYGMEIYKSSFPYYDTTYDEYISIETIFTNGDPDILNDKEKFKERVKEIIYNKEIIIEDKENEY